MASDDPYKSRGRAGNESRWLGGFYKSMRTRRYDRADWLVGVSPSEGSGSRDPGRPVGRNPALEFPEHQQALVRYLRSARGVEPRQRLADWAARVERLDVAKPQAGLAELRKIAGEYAQARSRYESHFSELTRPLWLNDEAAGIGAELRELNELFSEALRRT